MRVIARLTYGFKMQRARWVAASRPSNSLSITCRNCNPPGFSFKRSRAGRYLHSLAAVCDEMARSDDPRVLALGFQILANAPGEIINILSSGSGGMAS